MTLSSLQTLAEAPGGREQIRVMVAELMGPTIIGYTESILSGQLVPLYAGEGGPCYCPDYTESLDAIAECEAGLSNSDGERFRMHLDRIVGEGADNCHYAVHASALHRAMAFILVKTKGADRE